MGHIALAVWATMLVAAAAAIMQPWSYRVERAGFAIAGLLVGSLALFLLAGVWQWALTSAGWL